MKRMFHGVAAGVLALLSASASACNTEPYIGTICTFAFDWCPRGYVPADGRMLAVNANQALFGLLGFSYGGDGQNNFKIPDLRGRMAVGTGLGTGLTVAVGFTQAIGQQQLVLNASQAPVAQHTHPATFTGTGGGGGGVVVPAQPGNLSVTAALPVSTAVGTGATLAAGQNYLASMTATAGTNTVKFTGPYTTTAPGNPPPATLPVTVTMTGTAGTPAISIPATGITGGTVTVNPSNLVPASAAVSTQSPAMGMSVCIATQGLFPNRP